MDFCPETLNLARPSLSVWQVHKSLTWGDFISPSPRLGIEQSAIQDGTSML